MPKTRPTEAERLAAHFNAERPFRATVITMSDRAHAGDYEDRGGPLVVEHIEAFCNERDVVPAIQTEILPDEPEMLRDRLLRACWDGADVVIVTGGTGVGPRDITPNVVMGVAEKVIPGIMEMIRMKYGADKPCALLSRTVAATRGRTLIYAIPGSTKGVTEYMAEIAKTLQHLLVVLHELDPHE